MMYTLRSLIYYGNVQGSRNINTFRPLQLIQKWRKDRGLPLNPNATGVLTDGADYTFLDGRLTPYGEGQKARIMKQQEIKKSIITLSGEIDFAVERHNSLLKAEENKKRAILSRKLIPKGDALLKISKK